MSLMQPPIDELLEKTDNDKFLLCAVASERARDINDMMRGQRDRAKVLNSANQIAQLAGRKPLSLALEEIERDEISFDKQKFYNLQDAEAETAQNPEDEGFEFDFTPDGTQTAQPAIEPTIEQSVEHAIEKEFEELLGMVPKQPDDQEPELI